MALELVKDFGFGQKVNFVELSPDEQLLAVVSSKGQSIHVYDAHSGAQKWSVAFYSPGAAFSPDGTQLAVADTRGNCVKIFASETGALLKTLSGHTSNVSGVAWSSTGIVASSSIDKTVRLWNPDNGTCLQTLSGHHDYAVCVSLSPDGTRLASGSQNDMAIIWDVASGKRLHTLTHAEMVWRVAFSPDGSKLASASYDGTVRIWDASSDFSCIRSLAGAARDIYPTIAWSPDSRILAVADESILKLWDESRNPILQARNGATAVTFSRLSHDIIVGSKDGKLCRWKSRITWSLCNHLKNEISFGSLRLPSKSPDVVSGVLERISTIIDRMDPPSAFFDHIKLLHELNNNPSFVDMQTRASVVRDLEQLSSTLIDQRQSLKDAQTSLRQKASHRRPLAEVNEDLVNLESSEQFISRMKRHLKEYNQLQNESPSKDASCKQYEHSSPRDLPESELGDILNFARASHAKLARLEQVVTITANQFEKALVDYDQYSAEIREQSEKNVDAITAFLAFRPSTSISSERISEIERVISELQIALDKDADIMSKLDESLDELSSRKEQIDMHAAVERNTRKSQAKGSSWIHKLKGGFGKALSDVEKSSEDFHQQTAPLQTETENREHLRQQLEQAKLNLKATSGIAHNLHLVYKWLHEHPDAKLDAGEIFDLLGIR